MLDQVGLGHRKVFAHCLVSAAFVSAFIVLNRPEIILLSQIGSVAWYPAIGLAFAVFVAISPVYAVLNFLAIAVSGGLIYGQPLTNYSESIGAACISLIYVAAAFYLRDKQKIGLALERQRDVLAYVGTASLAAVASGISGTVCLLADHAITSRQIVLTAIKWTLGDLTGLLGVAPFLLVHVFPWVRKQLAAEPSETASTRGLAGENRLSLGFTFEVIVELLAIPAALWMMFGPSSGQLSYVIFVPVIWIAARHGMSRLVSVLVLVDFGIVAAQRWHRPEAEILLWEALLMLVVSVVGLVVGSIVSEQHRMARELASRAEELLEANTLLAAAKARAEESSRVKGEFLANMSHEIRTPINGIIGMTELALSTESSSEQQEYLGILKSSGDALLGVINDILDFSKIESGKLELDETELNLPDLMAETMKALSLRAHEKNLELAYLIDAKVPDTLRGDGGRLRQVLTNLVGNAIKFTAKGEVVVRVTLEGEEDGRLTLHFSVRDTGIGVPEDKFASIFEPFRQADGSTTRNYGGTGLGLAISSRLVALMDGRIWLESAVNQGSVFHFTGRFSKTRIVARHDESALKELAGVPLLIVDDNPTSGRILAEMTANWGMLPSGADNGDVALDAIQRAIAENSAFRIVVIDSRMPGVDGFELAERIQQMPRLKSTIIMMMVLAGPGGEAERCRRLGIPVYLLKPIRKADMLDAIQWVLGSTSNRRASHANETDVNRQFARSLRILVAEDNPVNEAVATRMLQKMGHTVSIAHNGQEAVSMTGNNGFDIVLMDVQMPVMDGFTAIQTIRNREMSAGLHLPIVAVTAHAMKGDQDRCIAAGADAYLPKPISGKRLAEVIARLIPDSGCPQGDSLMALPASSQVWDRTKALAHLDGDEVLLSELLDVFLEEAPKQIGAMRRAIADGDVSALEKAAHTLKGELGYFGLEETAAKARSIEDFAHQGELKGLTSIFQAFEAELSTSCAAMRDSQGVSHYRFSNSTEV